MRRPRTSNRESTIPLINVVFLMLIFFMVAGQIAPPMENDLSLVQTVDLDGLAPPDALVIHADGRLLFRDRAVVSAASYIRDLPEAERAAVRIVPDRDLDAGRLVQVAAELRAAGAERVRLVTERSLH